MTATPSVCLHGWRSRRRRRFRRRQAQAGQIWSATRPVSLAIDSACCTQHGWSFTLRLRAPSDPLGAVLRAAMCRARQERKQGWMDRWWCCLALAGSGIQPCFVAKIASNRALYSRKVQKLPIVTAGVRRLRDFFVWETGMHCRASRPIFFRFSCKNFLLLQCTLLLELIMMVQFTPRLLLSFLHSKVPKLAGFLAN